MRRARILAVLPAVLLLAVGCGSNQAPKSALLVGAWRGSIQFEGAITSTLTLDMFDAQGKPAPGGGQATGRAERIRT